MVELLHVLLLCLVLEDVEVGRSVKQGCRIAGIFPLEAHWLVVVGYDLFLA